MATNIFNNKIGGMMANVKARTLIIFVGVILLIGLAITLTVFKKEKPILENVPESRVRAVNKELKYIPGGKASEEYYQTQYQENAQRVETASNKGLSTIPTIVADQMVSSASIPSLEEKKRQKEITAAQEQQRMQEQQQREMQQQTEQQQTQVVQQNVQRQQAYEGLMSKQAQGLLASWAVSPTANYVGNVEPTPAEGAGGGAAGQPKPTIAPIYKAGDIIYAVLETAVNTDEPGPIMAKIVSNGPLKGSRIMGHVTVTGEYAQKALLRFNVINSPLLPNSIGFNGVAIDPETARTAIATDVDNHYLLRYGTLFAASFVEGMSDAVLAGLEGPNLEFNEATGFFIGESVQATTRDQVVAGFGRIGQNLGDSIDYFDRPATITIDSGTAMGILLMDDLALDANNKPMRAQSPIQAAHNFMGSRPARNNNNLTNNPNNPPSNNGGTMHIFEQQEALP